MKNQNRNGKGNGGNVILMVYRNNKTNFYKNKEKEEQYGSLNQVDTILADYVLICSSKYINLSEILDISECKATVAQSGRAPVLRTGILADIRVQSNSENPGGGALIYTQIYDTKNLKLKGNKEKSGFKEPVNSCANAKDVIDEELFKTYKNKEKEEQYGSLNQVELSVHDTNNIGNEIYKSFAQSAKPRSPNQVGRLPKKQVSVHDIRVQISDGNPVHGALISNFVQKTSSQINELNTSHTFTEIVGGID